ncbi:MAG: YceI family protein [Proteobacteria bacterium]|nr:YceI family protein [Pseudomonadota bacterium]
MTLLFVLLFASPAAAEPKTYMSQEGQVNSLLIFEQTGFARVYGIFTKGLARFFYDDALKTVDGLKLAMLANSFATASPVLRDDMSGHGAYDPDSEREIAFVQNEVARFENGKAKIKGQLVINNIRKNVVADADLNKFGRISETTHVMEEGKETLGFSFHLSFKRSEFSMSADSTTTPFNDDVVLMVDIIGQN